MSLNHVNKKSVVANPGDLPPASLSITNIGRFFTVDPRTDELICKEGLEISVHEGVIKDIGVTVPAGDVVLDAGGTTLTPGFIDPHTHPVFLRHRAHEFRRRAAGASYAEIAAEGGGILASLEGVRGASEDELYDSCLPRMDAFLRHGTTTIEAKSGYGLTLDSELKALRVLRRLSESHPLEIHSTFLGAHAFPPEFEGSHDSYVDLICGEMIPAVAGEKLATFCDVFCEKGYFTVNQARRILTSAREYGLIPRLHADEFVDSGAAGLAAEINAASADHLMAVSDEGIAFLARSKVVATLLPGTSWFLKSPRYTNGRRLLNAGITLALGTDFNPGSSTVNSMPFILALATLHCGLTVEEAFAAATVGAAQSLLKGHQLGTIASGFQADLLFWEIDDLAEIPYWGNDDRLKYVMKKGRVIDGG